MLSASAGDSLTRVTAVERRSAAGELAWVLQNVADPAEMQVFGADLAPAGTSRATRPCGCAR